MKRSQLLALLLFCIAPIFSYASEVKKSCECGPIEHVLVKKAVAWYAINNPGSGLIINEDTEGLTPNVVQALERLVQDYTFNNAENTPIQPIFFKDTTKKVLPLYKSPECSLIRSVIAQTNKHQMSRSPEELYTLWKNKVDILMPTGRAFCVEIVKK